MQPKVDAVAGGGNADEDDADDTEQSMASSADHIPLDGVLSKLPALDSLSVSFSV